jgi:hypothetical protein
VSDGTMNCFHHPQKPAVGHCTYCGRGLCKDCTAVVEGKPSCRGSCQEEIARERRLLANSESSLGQRTVIYETSSSIYQRNFAFTAAFGLAALAFGVFLIVGQMLIFGGILVVLAIVFLIHGLGMARAGRKFKALAAQGRDEGIPS